MDKQLTAPLEQHDENWRGYTLDELRYRRAYVKVKLELEKDALFHKSGDMVKNGKMLPASTMSRNIFGKVMGALNYFDYAFLAYKVGSRLLKITRTLRGSGRK